MPASAKFYGWTIATTLWFTYLLVVALPFYGASIMNAAMGKDLQLDKTTIGLGFSMITLVWGFSGPLTALLLNRIGLRYTVAIGAVIIAAGALVLGLFTNSSWMYIAAFGVIIGLGIGIASNLPTQTGIALWFIKKRALVLALVMTAPGIGGFLAPPLLNRIIAASDWRTAWLTVAATSLLCAAIAAIFLRNKPADLDQYPDGIVPDAGQRAIHTELPWAPREVIRNPAFWQILIAGIVLSAPTQMLVAHGAAHLEELGHSPAIAAKALGLMLLFSVPGRVLAGFLCDRFPPQIVWAGMLLLITVGVGIASVATTSPQVTTFAVLMGVGFGGSIICWAATTAHYFGPTSFATVMGMQTPFSTLITSAIPTLAGMLYDGTGSFSVAMWSLTAATLFGAVMILWARVPQRPAVASSDA